MTNNNWKSIKIKDFANQISLKNGGDESLEVVSVTKYRGIVPSLDYFRKQVYSKNLATYKIIKRNQFAYATIHLDEGSIGYLDCADKALLSPMYTVFEIDEAIVDKYFLYLFLKSNKMMNLYKKLGLGSVDRRKTIKFNDLSNAEIELPDLSIQKKITEIISSIDNAIHKTDQIIERVETLKLGLMEQSFSEKNPTKKLSEVLKFSQYGLSVKSASKGKYPMLRMNNYENGKIVPHPLVYIDLDEDSLNEYKLEIGDILFNRTNSHELVGKTGIFELQGDYVFASYLVRLKVNPEIINPQYLNYFMNSPRAKKQIETVKSRGVSQSNINPTTLKSRLICPVPSLDEQQKVVNILASVDAKLLSEVRRKHDLLLLKNGVMQEIFNQKVQLS